MKKKEPKFKVGDQVKAVFDTDKGAYSVCGTIMLINENWAVLNLGGTSQASVSISQLRRVEK